METAFIALVIIMAGRELSHYKQDVRRDSLISELTDKLKASSFTEYKEQTTPPPVFDAVSNDDNTLYWKEIEESKQ